LWELQLFSNSLSGSIPPELGNLLQLEYLFLNYNQLSGSIPPELGNLPTLLWLDLYSNQLTGSIPPTLGNLTNLEGLRLYSNPLSGSIPPELGNLLNLRVLHLSDNQLVGSIPPELSNLDQLVTLFLSDNQLTGNIPSELGSLPNLESLALSSNQLTGGIPPELGNLFSLTSLSLYNNQLVGTIPSELGNLSNLSALMLSSNQLTGSIPPELGNLFNLEVLFFHSNQLTGCIPLTFTNLTSMYQFEFYNTQLCEPNTTEFLAWKATVAYWSGTGIICDPPAIPFQPNPDGYSFPNWGSISYSDYTYSDLVRMFGAEAACWSLGSVCVLNPKAELFNWTANSSMKGGHCLGMSVTSSRFYTGVDLHSGFEGTFDLSKDSTVTVNWLSNTFSSTARRNISYFQVMQSTEPIAGLISENMQKTPSEFIFELSTFMDNPGNDYPVLVFYDNTMNGGHAVTPYAIEGQGDGVFYVKIYDNNFPDNFDRKITINELENTWSYYGNYQGNAGSHNLAFIPISLFAQRPQCPWCQNTLNSISLMQLNYDGSGEFLITDSLGNRLGFQAGVFYNEIPGAFANPQLGGLEVDSQPIFYLPVSGEYDITIDGAITEAPDTGSLVTYGPGYAVQIAGITTAPTTRDEISISSNGTSFTYQPNQAQQVDVGLYIDTDTASWQLQTGQVDVAAGQTGLIMVDPAQKTLTVNNLQNAAGDYNLFFKRVSDNGTALYASNAIALPAAVTHSIHFDGWQESGTVELDTDTNGDGIPEETIFLENQMKYLFLPLTFR